MAKTVWTKKHSSIYYLAFYRKCLLAYGIVEILKVVKFVLLCLLWAAHPFLLSKSFQDFLLELQIPHWVVLGGIAFTPWAR